MVFSLDSLSSRARDCMRVITLAPAAHYFADRVTKLAQKGGRRVLQSAEFMTHSATIKKFVGMTDAFSQEDEANNGWDPNLLLKSDFAVAQAGMARFSWGELMGDFIQQAQGQIKLDIAISTETEFLFFLSGRDETSLKGDFFAAFNNLLQAYLAEHGKAVVGEDSVIYEVDANGQRLQDAKNNYIKADPKEIGRLLKKFNAFILDKLDAHINQSLKDTGYKCKKGKIFSEDNQQVDPQKVKELSNETKEFLAQFSPKTPLIEVRSHAFAKAAQTEEAYLSPEVRR